MPTRGNRDLQRRDFLKLLAGGAYLLGGVSRAALAREEPAGPILLENTAPQSGLDFVLRNDAAGRKYQVETVLGGLGVIDFDADGWPDLYCTNGAALPSLEKSSKRFYNRLYKNNRDGTFTDVTERAGVRGRGYCMGVAVGDYQNDGHEDLYVLGVHGNALYRNNGDGTFTDVTEDAGVGGTDARGNKLWSVAAAWIDYDNDGFLDLIVSNYCDWSAGKDPVCGGLGQSSRTYCHPDMYRAEPLLVYHNNGDGTFRDATQEVGLQSILGKGMGIAVADFDGDGRPDVFIANDNAKNLLLHGAGKAFEEIGLEAGVAFNGDGRQISGMGADFGDFDGDGKPDIVMTGLRRETFELFRNLGDGTFEDASASSGLLQLSQKWNGWGCGFADLDNDGMLDLFVANGGLDVDEPQPNRIFRNTGGKFADVSEEAGAGFALAALHRGAAFADFDNDGRLDVAVSAINAPIELWKNRSPERSWLQVKLRGTRSNRSALGARIICRSASRTQVRFVANSVGYASASDLRVHFGLGRDTKVSLEIQWPSGIRQKIENLSVNQRLEAVEPDRLPQAIK